MKRVLMIAIVVLGMSSCDGDDDRMYNCACTARVTMMGETATATATTVVMGDEGRRACIAQSIVANADGYSSVTTCRIQ